MSLKKEVKSSQPVVKTTTRQKNASAADGYDLLEPVEEKCIRMRFGLSEDDNKILEYAVGASEESLARVTMMEAENIVELKGEVPTHGEIPADVMINTCSHSK